MQSTVCDAMRAAGLSRNPVASGRTDAGVHARMQVLSFRLVEPGPVEDLPTRINAHLPAGVVGISLAREAPPHFNAHWRASQKEYRYRLALTDGPRWQGSAWPVRPDLAQLQQTLHLAVGTHDFFAFHDKSSVVRPRTVTSVEVVELGDVVDVRLRGEGFGRFMVRYLVAGAVAVASGGWSRSGFEEALALGASSPHRPPQLVRAPASGLILWSVDYPAADDPFTAEERLAAPGLPREPPFVER